MRYRHMLSSLCRLTRALVLAGFAVGMVVAVSGRTLGQTPPSPEAPGAAPAATAGAAAAPAEVEAKGGLLDPDLGTAFFTILIFVALLIILALHRVEADSRGAQRA